MYPNLITLYRKQLFWFFYVLVKHSNYPQSIDRTVQITEMGKNVAYLCVQVEICYLTIEF